MPLKIISQNEKKIIVELTVDLDNENFLETEEKIMDKVNELGQVLTKQALERLDIKQTILTINEKTHYAKEVKKNTRPLTVKSN